MQVQAEKAAWKFAEDHNIDLVTIQPSVIIGPVLSARGGISVSQVQVNQRCNASMPPKTQA